MKTGIILAGGNSKRMGQDKALLFSNVDRLASELSSSGCTRIIVMCGTVERQSLFEHETIPDKFDNLGESLIHVIAEIDGFIQLAPCDAYLADSNLFKSINGVPVDDLGNRQPLMSGFNSEIKLNQSKKISDIFAKDKGSISLRSAPAAKAFSEPFKTIHFTSEFSSCSLQVS